MHTRLTKNTLLCIISWVLACWIPAIAQQAASGPGQPKSNLLAPTEGLYTNTADLLRSKEYAKTLNNLQMTKRGIWTDRGTGFTRQRAGTFNSGTSFLEFATHFTSDGTQRFVFQVGGKVYSYDLGTSTETQITTGLSTTAVPCMRSYSAGVFIYVNGDAEPMNWDGVPANVMTSPGAWPPTVATVSYSKPKIVELFVTRAAYAGFPANPYTVLLSTASNANTFTISSPLTATDGGAFTVPSALGPIVGLKTLRLGNSSNDQILVIGCTRGMAFIGGSDATNFYMRELTRSHGLISNRAWLQLQNDLYYAGTDGIRTVSNLNTSATLAPDTLTYPLNDLYNRIVPSLTAKIFAVHHPSTQEVQFWLPIDSDTVPAHVLVMNYNTSKNTDGTIAPIWSTKDGISGTCGFDYNGRTFIGTSSGYLNEFYTADDNNGTYIAWSFVPALIETNAQNPMQSSSSKRVLLLTEGPAQAFTVTAYGVNTSSSNETMWTELFQQAVTASTSSITDIGTWQSGTTTTYPHIIEFDPTGSARYWGLRLHAAQTGDHINLVGVMQLQTVGGLKQ